jgi:hypothetical protein
MVMWHHPLYSSAGLGWPSMEPTWQILYDAGVELVLSGHAHSYERFAPMDATGPVDPAFGVRQFVVGTGGKNLGGPRARAARERGLQRRDLRAPCGSSCVPIATSGSSCARAASASTSRGPALPRRAQRPPARRG